MLQLSQQSMQEERPVAMAITTSYLCIRPSQRPSQHKPPTHHTLTKLRLLQYHRAHLHLHVLIQVLCRQVLDASFGDREQSTEKILGPAGIRTQDLLSTSQTLLPLSHWADGRGAEARLHITAQARSQCMVPLVDLPKQR